MVKMFADVSAGEAVAVAVEYPVKRGSFQHSMVDTGPQMVVIRLKLLSRHIFASMVFRSVMNPLGMISTYLLSFYTFAQ